MKHRHLKKLFISNQIDLAWENGFFEALQRFFDKLPEEIEKSFINTSMIIFAGKNVIVPITLDSDMYDKQSLLMIGCLDDLDTNSLIGLIAHLFGLIYCRFYFSDDKTPETRFAEDLIADKVAIGWSFKFEISKFREIRPYKKPIEYIYQLPILPSSTPSNNFKNIIRKETSSLEHSDWAIFYTEKFSMVQEVLSLKRAEIARLLLLYNKSLNVNQLRLLVKEITK